MNPNKVSRDIDINSVFGMSAALEAIYQSLNAPPKPVEKQVEGKVIESCDVCQGKGFITIEHEEELDERGMGRRYDRDMPCPECTLCARCQHTEADCQCAAWDRAEEESANLHPIQDGGGVIGWE